MSDRDRTRPAAVESAAGAVLVLAGWPAAGALAVLAVRRDPCATRRS